MVAKLGESGEPSGSGSVCVRVCVGGGEMYNQV